MKKIILTVLVLLLELPLLAQQTMILKPDGTLKPSDKSIINREVIPLSPANLFLSDKKILLQHNNTEGVSNTIDTISYNNGSFNVSFGFGGPAPEGGQGGEG